MRQWVKNNYNNVNKYELVFVLALYQWILLIIIVFEGGKKK